MNIFTSIFNYLFSAIPLGMTFLYGSTGEILTEKAGHLNLGIPGIMCVGAAGGCASIQLLINAGITNPVLIVVVGILCAFLSGALMGLIYSVLAVTFHANQNVTGLALTTFGVGVMKFTMTKLLPVKYLNALPYFRFPFNSSQTSLKYCGVMVFLGIAVAIATSYVLFRTRVGLHLRAVGENPATADAVGINVSLYKYMATCIGSGISGLGGLFYIMDYAGSREAYLSIEALGWLAIALVIFALWKPHVSIFGSAIFGALFVAGSFIPSLIPIAMLQKMEATPLLKMLPYVVTVIVLVVTSIRDKKENQPPASLGVPYFREER
ncbi:MAG: ABC transporter permease [Ruminococcaceae bacterium]|nr:ABC transporter permease [Oscillospiraceae bacterium]MBQ1258948.1 ABC transporter permease [Clostridia bacterium]